jgi:hypothetical protein
MKKTLTLLVALVACGIFTHFLFADTGSEGATRIERGMYTQTRVVAVVDSAAVEMFPPTRKRADGMCKNYSSFTVFIGSAAAGVTLRDIGLPLGASEYFRIDGSMTGDIYVIGAAGGTNMQMRCFEGLSYQ